MHIELTGIKHRSPCKQIFLPFLHTLEIKTFFLLTVVMLHIKFKRKKNVEYCASKLFDLMHTPDILEFSEKIIH